MARRGGADDIRDHGPTRERPHAAARALRSLEDHAHCKGHVLCIVSEQAIARRVVSIPIGTRVSLDIKLLAKLAG